MKVTAILCTYNRCASLKKTLDSLAVSKAPSAIDWQVLVVDNNSKDDTRAVAESFAAREPARFRYLFEPRQGKSYALNSGIAAAEAADVLAFVDDDVVVEPEWLGNLVAPLVDTAWSGTGGKILPEAGFHSPAWLRFDASDTLAPLAMFDQGDEACELKTTPFGTNMAFRRELFARYGGFRIDLGPQPGSEIRNEDTEFGTRVLAGGERLWYVPTAVVYHAVPAKRATQAYFLKWWFDKARADVREEGALPSRGWRIGGVPLVLFRRFVRWGILFAFSTNPGRRFYCKTKVWSLCGTIRERFTQARNGRSGQDAALGSLKNPPVLK